MELIVELFLGGNEVCFYDLYLIVIQIKMGVLFCDFILFFN